MTLMQGKHVVFIVTAKVTAENFLWKFALFVAEQGFRVTIIADGLETQYSHDHSVSMIGLPMKRNPSLINDFKSFIALIGVFRSIQPDLIVYATPKASLLSSIAGYLLRVPKRVYLIWGLRLETTSGIMRVLLSAMEKVTTFCSTKVVANSRSLRTRYLELGLNSGRQVAVLGKGSSHGVDLEYFSRDGRESELDPKFQSFLDSHRDHFKLGFVGRLHPDKGIDTLIEASLKVAASGKKVALILVGGDEGAEIKIQSSSSMSLFRVPSVKDVRPYYQNLDLLCLPSLREGFPNVILESAAMGVPAIVSDATGVVDSVVDGETGLVARVGDPEAFKEAIERLIEDPVFREILGRNARHRVEEFFQQEKVWAMNLQYFFDV